MLRLSPTRIRLSPIDLERFIPFVENQTTAVSAIDLLATSLRAEAIPFTPGPNRAGSVTGSPAHSFPTPSPHLDRYPVLLRAERQRRNTTQTRVPPSLQPGYSPSSHPDISQTRHHSIERLNVKLKQRELSSASRHGAAATLRDEHSPLDELMNELQIVQNTFMPGLHASSQHGQQLHEQHSTSSVETLPIAVTVSRVSSFPYPAYQHQHAQHLSHRSELYQGLPQTQEEASVTQRRTPVAHPAIAPDPPQALTSTSARRRVQVYHDSPLSFHESYAMSDSNRRSHHRATVSQDEASIPAEPDRHSHRHTYPQHDASGRLHSQSPLRSGFENDEYAQLGLLVNVREQRYDDMNTTPPVRRRYEQYMDQTFF